MTSLPRIARGFWLGVVACTAASCDGLLGCTDAGCTDGVTVRLEGVDPADVLAFTMHVEGRDPIVLACYAEGFCSADELLDGQNFTPGEISLTLELADTTITRVFEPDYRDYRPNGSGCEPVCQVATVTFTVE